MVKKCVKSTNPQLQEGLNKPQIQKHAENATKVHHNQIGQNQWQRQMSTAARWGKHGAYRATMRMRAHFSEHLMAGGRRGSNVLQTWRKSHPTAVLYLAKMSFKNKGEILSQTYRR